MDSTKVHGRAMAATEIHLILLHFDGFWQTDKFCIYYYLADV
jgi:hypothetical protein